MGHHDGPQRGRPGVGGLLVTVDWWIFLINLPVGIATIVADALVLPEVRQAAGGQPALPPHPRRRA
ncbi:MAG TPA: hypothetical protein VGI96_35630 [Streptosporangiaceae bacterium]|jgi:hypothetical protein